MSLRAQNERLLPFFEKLKTTPHGSYEHAIKALRVLSDAGWTAAAHYRRKDGAAQMGNQFFDGKDYIPYVIEHSVAYLNGRKDLLQTIALYYEDNPIDSAADRNGVLAVVNLLKDTIGEGRYSGAKRDWFDSLYVPQETVIELRSIWNEHPEIPAVLRGDLMVHRAVNTPDRSLARIYFQNAQERGVSSKIDIDHMYKELFAAPSPKAM